MKNKLLIMLSKSSCGKDYVVNKLVSDYNFQPLISHTSRPRRPSEINHLSYHFVSTNEFLSMISNDEFIEYRTYNTLVDNVPDIWYYGLSKNTIDKLNTSTNYVTIFDVQGAKDFIEYYGRENCYVCMINCDDNIREERAKLRGGFSQFEWDRRLASDLVIFSKDNTNGLIDYYIDNDGTLEELNDEVKHYIDMILKEKEII